MSKERYAQRGVSASKSDVHKAIKNLDKGLYPLAFCKILPDVLHGKEDVFTIMHADTAGTKPSLAYLYWKETGDMSVWEGIVQDALVMNLDDMGCVGCLENIVLSSTIGRNAKLIPGEILTALIQGTQTFLQQLSDHNIHVHHSGGETADVGDIVRTLDVGFTTFAQLNKDQLVVNDIKAGDVIVGFASHGQASYETSYNGGMGSNGLTSARHDVLDKIYAEKYPESFDPNVDKNYIYSGSKKLTDTIEINGEHIPIGKLILSPTRTYLPLLRPILDEYKDQINGIIHCTGGAQTKVIKFIENKRVIKDNLFDLPPLFKLIQDESGTEWEEMYKVFNMGHRLEIYLAQDHAQSLIDIAAELNIEAQIIGRVEDATRNEVVIQSPYGEFHYTE